jgi:mRNA-degrading endonuclease HigB of HigAB toxin-antitoxin module
MKQASPVPHTNGACRLAQPLAALSALRSLTSLARRSENRKAACHQEKFSITLRLYSARHYSEALERVAHKHPHTKSSLARWYAIMRKGRFLNFPQLREIFPQADQVGKFTVLNIGGNKVRLIAVVHIITETNLHPPRVDSSGIRHWQLEKIICQSPNSKT